MVWPPPSDPSSDVQTQPGEAWRLLPVPLMKPGRRFDEHPDRCLGDRRPGSAETMPDEIEPTGQRHRIDSAAPALKPSPDKAD